MSTHLIVGAGAVGTATALQLGRAGHRRLAPIIIAANIMADASFPGHMRISRADWLTIDV